ncbi:hypothetical protein L6164_006329 [Bauhinia variegata]|uniref:Uncharacterized protein n=1 Tax=Bauhinia variegata TaxID=167791 RepID=A0ACB9PU67_BAUVA|nr:hypothetical protein L6164_006329 [Bauhinia variegata]
MNPSSEAARIALCKALGVFSSRIDSDFAPMATQDQTEHTRPSSAATAGNFYSNGGQQSENALQLADATSVGNNHAPKVRKPYTITKQREKWTEEEHQKFLEALKLYGRGWRQIEEHVGTKTAVQIRSHAQKFFSKVARESNGCTESSVKPIDIPPPRPKRKPLHPYPRKSIDSYKGHTISNEAERSPSPNLVISEKDTQSPTSVLTALGSEAFGSACSEQTNRCISPNSCTTDIHSASLSPVDKENDCLTSNLSEEEGKGSRAASSLPTGRNQDCLFKKLELNSEASQYSKEATANVPTTSTIKLFGRTVNIVDSQKSLNVDEENIKSIACKPNEVVIFENEKLDETCPSKQSELSLGLYSGDCKVKCMEYPKEKPGFVETIPQWNLYPGVPVFYLEPSNQILNPKPLRPSLKERMTEKESSCTGSNSESVSETINGDKNSNAGDSHSQSRHHERTVPHKTPRGFVPYKRCLAERDSSSLIVAMEEREGQRARVCS